MKKTERRPNRNGRPRQSRLFPKARKQPVEDVPDVARALVAGFGDPPRITVVEIPDGEIVGQPVDTVGTVRGETRGDTGEIKRRAHGKR